MIASSFFLGGGVGQGTPFFPPVVYYSPNYIHQDVFTFLKIPRKCRGGGGGDSHIKMEGMLIVSLRGVNLGFWCHLGYSGQNATICSREGFL